MKKCRSTKYNNKKVVSDGLTFDSKREYARWCELQLMERAHLISGLERQKRFTVIPKQKSKSGKVLERECVYIADFVYRDKDGALVVEDAKGKPTRDYIIKRKLMLYRFGIRVQEV